MSRSQRIWTEIRDLAAGDITPPELKRLLKTAADESVEFEYTLVYRGGRDKRQAHQIDEPIQDFETLKSVIIEVKYAENDKLTIVLSADPPRVSWEGRVAAEKAHWLESDWNSFPDRARISRTTARRICRSVLWGLGLYLVAYLIVQFSFPSGAVAWISYLEAVWRQASAVAIIAAAFTWGTSGRASVFRAVRASHRPFVATRAGRLIRNWQFLISTAIALLSLIVAVIDLFTA